VTAFADRDAFQLSTPPACPFARNSDMTSMRAAVPSEASSSEWPPESLERVPHCPVCGDTERRTLHEGLVDNTFRVTGGNWTLVECAACASAFLDPRPRPESIGRAYQRYYTHTRGDVPRPPYESLDLGRKIRRRLSNGYTNRRFGTKHAPASTLGPLIARLMPGQRRKLDRQHRSLPVPREGRRRLLDLGCGDGSFLQIAASCGWQAEGLDPDPHAAATAGSRGMTVHAGGIDVFDGQSEQFDAITMSHVIEHLHDPMAVLRACHRLLRPGGTIWIETPNVASQGHRRFGVHWPGLDAPRHLVLFNSRSLRAALERAGFRSILDVSSPNVCLDTYRISYGISRGVLFGDALAAPARLKMESRLAAFVASLRPALRENLSILASRASA
jgi:2-polyprenyl-3-methyl-5-hydroxy-6-metoxy-1,4-benzoquinol methylase